MRDARAYVRRARAKWDSGGTEYSITEDGHYIGSIGTSAPSPGAGRARLSGGAVGARQGRGRGGGARVAEWLLDRGVERVELAAEVANLPSLRVAYKAGFREEGRRRDAKALRDGQRVDHVMFARLARDAGEVMEPYLPFFEGGELGDGVVRLTPMDERDAARLPPDDGGAERARFGIGPLGTLEDDEQRCRCTGYFWLSGQRVELAVRDAATGEFAGNLQLVTRIIPAFGEAMVGYSLGRASAAAAS